MFSIIDGWVERRACDLAYIYGLQNDLAAKALKYGIYSFIGVCIITAGLYLWRKSQAVIA